MLLNCSGFSKLRTKSLPLPQGMTVICVCGAVSYTHLTIFDFIDIVLVSYLVYKGIKLVRETRAEQLVKGIVILAVSYAIASFIHLEMLSFVLTNIFTFGLLAIIVVFQPELRRALEKAVSYTHLDVYKRQQQDIPEVDKQD